jgi:hypothetical protein
MSQYPRELIEYSQELNREMNENIKTLKMLETPYRVNALQSNTDSSTYNQDNNQLNKWMRYSVYSEADDLTQKGAFSRRSIDWMSGEITLRLTGIHPEGKRIKVPDSTILSVMDSVYNNGNLDVEQMRQQVVMYIVEAVKNDFQITENNDKLDIWITKLDMTSGMQKFNDVKLNEKTKTQFYSWNY